MWLRQCGGEKQRFAEATVNRRCSGFEGIYGLGKGTSGGRGWSGATFRQGFERVLIFHSMCVQSVAAIGVVFWVRGHNHPTRKVYSDQIQILQFKNINS